MKTTVVPAQITTVEDRIAGNFTFTQIVILIIPLLIGTTIYIVAPPKLHFGGIKFVFMVLQFLLIGGLAIRFREKIIADWLLIYLRFTSRPRKYVFTKNDSMGRLEIKPIRHKKAVRKKMRQETKKEYEVLAPEDETQINRLIENPALSLSFKMAKKGGIDVSVKPKKN